VESRKYTAGTVEAKCNTDEGVNTQLRMKGTVIQTSHIKVRGGVSNSPTTFSLSRPNVPTEIRDTYHRYTASMLIHFGTFT